MENGVEKRMKNEMESRINTWVILKIMGPSGYRLYYGI